jgi:hypothetical protein
MKENPEQISKIGLEEGAIPSSSLGPLRSDKLPDRRESHHKSR